MAQHILQDAAVLEVVELIERIDPTNQWNALERTVRRNDFGDQPLPRLEVPVQPTDRDGLVAAQAERLPGRSLLEHEWDHAHPDQVGPVDALERLRDDRTDAEQGRSLGGPVARRAGP